MLLGAGFTALSLVLLVGDGELASLDCGEGELLVLKFCCGDGVLLELASGDGVMPALIVGLGLGDNVPVDVPLLPPALLL